jgi:membrane-associated phospholipid phosphatase
MSFWKNPYISWPISAAVGLGLGTIAACAHGDEILRLNSLRQSPLNELFLFKKKKIQAAMLVGGMGLAMIPINYYVKHFIGTDRPITFFEKKGVLDQLVTVPSVEMNGGQTSFPSGHSSSAMALATLMAGIFQADVRKRPTLAILLVLIPILTGFSRIFLAQHFAVDVLGGWLLGIICGFSGLYLLKILESQYAPRKNNPVA